MSKELMRQNIEKAQREIDAKKEMRGAGQGCASTTTLCRRPAVLNDPNGLMYYKGKYHFFLPAQPIRGLLVQHALGPCGERRI